MKSVSTLPKNKKDINVQLASFACGLALATVAFIGAGEILKDGNGSTPQTSPPAKAVLPGVVMPEPDFGSAAGDYSAFKRPLTAPWIIGLVMPEPDFGSVPADYSAFRPSTEGPSEQSIIDPHFGTGPESVSVIEGEN